MLAKLGIRAVSPCCFFCQRRAFSASHTLLSAEKTPTKEPLPTNPPISTDTNTPTPVSTTTPTTTDTAPRDDHDSPLANAPRSHGKRLDDFTPTVLSRPIGFAAPPKPGENTGVDGRTFKQRREDFINPEKHRARRRDMYVTSIHLPFLLASSSPLPYPWPLRLVSPAAFCRTVPSWAAGVFFLFYLLT